MITDLCGTQKLAENIARAARAGDVITLSGEVGTGKTTFTQAFIGALVPGENVTSPTFTLVQPYTAKDGTPILHADLYRLKHAQEFTELGIEDGFEKNITLIEWPEIARSYLPEGTLSVSIEYISHDTRRFVLYSEAKHWQTFLKSL